ncbi:MAG: histidine--tRNA ligase [Candidatus Paceibacterota bacterium]
MNKKTAPQKKEKDKMILKKEIRDDKEGETEKKGKKARQTFQSVKGIYEILPEEWVWREKFEAMVKGVAHFYDFKRIETGIIENADLFTRSVGEGTDIVKKEMFFLKSGGSHGDKWVLRPEGTASVARAYLQYGFSSLPQPVKLFYLGPMFRHENPQAGRYRQLTTAGFEIIGGENDAVYDAEVLQIAFRIMREAGLKDAVAEINSIGCRVCRPNLKKKLVNYYSSKTRKICRDCQERLKQNPFRLLDCKNEMCQEIKKDAPVFLDGLCSVCKHHFKNFLEYLDELKIPYEVNNNLVRGLDYYSRTVFEIFVPSSEQAKLAVAGGGRYDYLIETIGGRPTAGVGFGIGIERLVSIIREKALKPPAKPKNRIFFIHVGDVAKKRSLTVIEELRENGIAVRESLGKDSLQKQMKLADVEGVEWVLMFGQKEVYEESVIIKNMKTGIQETILLRKVTDELKRRMK